MFISVGETLVSDTNQSAISVLLRSNLIGSIRTDTKQKTQLTCVVSQLASLYSSEKHIFLYWASLMNRQLP